MKARPEILYLAALAGLMALIAAARFDLVELAFRTTLHELGKGGAVRIKLLAEIALFGGILLFTLWVIPRKAAPRRDACIVGAAALAGFFAESWGTDLGLWRYYTGERPPLWIVPAWPLGALVIDRCSDMTRTLLETWLDPRAVRAAWGFMVLLVLGYFVAFSARWLTHPATLIVLAGLAAALFLRPDPSRDLPVLLTGACCVFFADLWGTTNNCWRYHIQDGSLLTLAGGVSFGALFDSAVVLLCLKGVEAYRPFGPCKG
ncbi:MAG: hypothetical protein A2X36_06560 [Elusimicrobia bacterium GWA2_69_24]|nr:MAG: hypothetical protein A2X36_06560 [Elusimicrobia bacterium GWA2_69_24]HBL17955.1 hypothetical protein [Elusimicrobiota bacterium]